MHSPQQDQPEIQDIDPSITRGMNCYKQAAGIGLQRLGGHRGGRSLSRNLKHCKQLRDLNSRLKLLTLCEAGVCKSLPGTERRQT